MALTEKEAAVAAYVLGWRQNDNGAWFHPEYDRDGDPPFSSPHQVVAYEGAYLENGEWKAANRG